ncbi:MAG: ClbS/DfsB family four-helix bundle protein [Candidatus Adiutrix sp.]|nr:ClbS/DfsB family four-helix bundle protein [Candidatus Adiutrix sp.]
MSRATTKQDLIEAATAQFDKLGKTIDSMTEKEQTAIFRFGADFLQKRKEAHWGRDKNLRDVLVHLYEWHKLLLNWVKANQAGISKPFIPEPYNWKTYPQMNVGFWEKHQNTRYSQAQIMLKESHAEVTALIETFSNEELFSKNHFSWTGTSTLGSYCVSATASHYDWAMKKIKQHLKTLKK